MSAAQYNSLSWGEMESCRLIACRCEIVNGSLDLELFLSECLIPVHRYVGEQGSIFSGVLITMLYVEQPDPSKVSTP